MEIYMFRKLGHHKKIPPTEQWNKSQFHIRLQKNGFFIYLDKLLGLK